MAVLLLRETAVTNDPAVLQSVTPIFQVRDFVEAIDWYQAVLGFRVEWTSGEPADLASLSRDRTEINLALAAGRPPIISRVYFETKGVAALYERVSRAGANIAVPLASRPYGMKDFRVEDPSGNQLSFGEPLG
jgi:uncharacterized glyoxalase superfamily protein PhnB